MDIMEDIYTLICKDSKKSLQIDLTTPYILNSLSSIINVPYENIIIKNSIGEVIVEIDKKDLLTIIEKDNVGEDITYYFLNLVDILFDPIEVVGYTYSKLYPLKELEEKEYGLLQGKIVTGKDVIVDVKGYELIITEVDVVRVVNYSNGNYFKRVDENFTYYSEQILGDDVLKNVVKLNNVAIEKGSILIEEYYENGETYTSTPTSNLRYINVNTIQEPNYVQVDQDSQTETYLQE